MMHLAPRAQRWQYAPAAMGYYKPPSTWYLQLTYTFVIFTALFAQVQGALNDFRWVHQPRVFVRLTITAE
jgi:hypothetical protein